MPETPTQSPQAARPQAESKPPGPKPEFPANIVFRNDQPQNTEKK